MCNLGVALSGIGNKVCGAIRNIRRKMNKCTTHTPPPIGWSSLQEFWLGTELLPCTADWFPTLFAIALEQLSGWPKLWGASKFVVSWYYLAIMWLCLSQLRTSSIAPIVKHWHKYVPGINWLAVTWNLWEEWHWKQSYDDWGHNHAEEITVDQSACLPFKVIWLSKWEFPFPTILGLWSSILYHEIVDMGGY